MWPRNGISTCAAKLRTGRLEPLAHAEKTFGEAPQAYLREVPHPRASVRSPSYVKMLELRMNAHILPFFQDKPLSAINKGLVQRYRVQRAGETIARTPQRADDGDLPRLQPRPLQHDP